MIRSTMCIAMFVSSLLAVSGGDISGSEWPEIVAHRGASYDAPENTLAALKLAWEQQAEGSEFDVYQTVDGQIVVIHDKSTKRTAGVDLPVDKSTLEQLAKLEVGAWKHSRFQGEKIPTLVDMLREVPSGKYVFIEVKCGPEVVPELKRVLAESKLKNEQVPVISFNAEVVRAFKQACPEIAAYWIVAINEKKPVTAEQLIAKAREVKADGVDLSASKLVTKELVAQLHEAKLKVYVWTVNDVQLARDMIAAGVDGITTDRPAWLREQLKSPP